MESIVGSLAAPPPYDESHPFLRDPPQLPHFRIPPLRDPVPSRTLKAPFPLEPSTGGLRDLSITKPHNTNSNPPTELPTLADFLNAARGDKLAQYVLTNLDAPPKPILPFINLRTVENLPNPFDEETPRKRARLDLQDGFGEHLQLPVPKIHKEASKPRSFGPLAILNGLNEPPPNAALFPPIETNSTPTILTRPSRELDEERTSRTRNDGRRHDIREIIEPDTDQVGNDSRTIDDDGDKAVEPRKPETRTKPQEGSETSSTQHLLPLTGTKPRRKLRKWSEQETTDLLRGVVRCGVGNWTAILAQPDLKFNNRTAANLKDRFRVCCPWAYESGDKAAFDAVQTKLTGTVFGPESDSTSKIVLPDLRNSKSKDLQLGGGTPTADGDVGIAKLLHKPPSPRKPNANTEDMSEANRGTDQVTKGNQTLSQKAKATLRSLGLEDPQTSVKSNRRPRQPFTPEEDKALLKGYNIHGFQWKLIQQDKRFNLMHRKATVLRDRFRTRFPDVYKNGGATAINIEEIGKEGTPTSDSSSPEKPGRTSKPSKVENLSFQPPSAHLRNNDRNPSPRSFGQLNVNSGGTAAISNDPVILPPALPSLLPDFPRVAPHSMFSFPIDDQGTGPADGSSDLRWVDNTLPPPVWDDI
ncbi:hypothetical protein VTO42DRAFT_1671 [Malbranchea cinnamomea]